MKLVPFGDSHSVFWGRQQSFETPVSNVAGDLVAFERFCVAMNGTSANIFDTRDAWSDAFKAYLQAHRKKMEQRGTAR